MNFVPARNLALEKTYNFLPIASMGSCAVGHPPARTNAHEPKHAHMCFCVGPMDVLVVSGSWANIEDTIAKYFTDILFCKSVVSTPWITTTCREKSGDSRHEAAD